MTKFDTQHLDEWLSAYLDGELTEKEAQLVEATLRENENARHRLSDLRRTASLVTGLPRHTAPPTIAEEIMARLERSELLDDVPEAVRSGRRVRLRWPVWTSLAAAFAATVLGGWWVLGPKGPDKQASPLVSGVVSAHNETDASDASRSKDSLRKEDRLALGEKKAESPEKALSDAVRARRAISEEESAGSRSNSAVSLEAKRADRSTPAESPPPMPVDLETKLASGFDASKVSSHRFRDETVRLRVQVRNPEKIEEIANAVRSQLIASGVSDLEDERNANGRAKTHAPLRFVQRGTPGANFDEKDSRQIIARVSAKDLEVTLGQLTTAGVSDADVQLSAGTLVFSGPDSIRGTLKNLGSQTPSAKENVPGRTDSPPSLADRDVGLKASPAPSSLSANKGRRSSEQWTELWDMFSKTMTAPSRPDPGATGASSSGEIHKSAADPSAAHAADAPNASVAVPTSLVTRRVEAAQSERESSVANLPVTIEMNSPSTPKDLKSEVASDPSKAGAQPDPLITLVIEVAPLPKPPTKDVPAPTVNPVPPAKPPAAPTRS